MVDTTTSGVPPPDGGARAWLVMLGAFFCNGIIFGVVNSYSVLYTPIYNNLQAQNVTSPTGKAALVGSLAIGTTFIMSPVSGVLTDLIGIRMTTFVGGVLASGGMLLSSFFIDHIAAIYFTYSIMYGLGGSLAYTPSLAILSHYFHRYLGVVNGIVAAGSSAFTVAMPYVIDGLLVHCGLRWTLRVLAAITALLMACAFLFRPLAEIPPHANLRRAYNPNILRNKKYVIWVVLIACSLFGYFVPYVYIKKFVEKEFPTTVDGKLPILCIGVTSGIGRLLFGFLADIPRVDRILLQQLAFFSIGILTILLPFTSSSYGWLLVISLGMGLFDGCFISLIGPIASDLCGPEGTAQAIGYLLGLCSVPLTVGPYVAGFIYEQQNSYTLVFILAGVPPTLGAALLFLTRCVTPEKKAPDEPCEKPLRTKKEAGIAGEEDLPL